jgi:hypothetical protein
MAILYTLQETGAIKPYLLAVMHVRAVRPYVYCHAHTSKSILIHTAQCQRSNNLCVVHKINQALQGCRNVLAVKQPLHACTTCFLVLLPTHNIAQTPHATSSSCIAVRQPLITRSSASAAAAAASFSTAASSTCCGLVVPGCPSSFTLPAACAQTPRTGCVRRCLGLPP